MEAFNSPNVNVLKILFITSCRLNDDVILHFTKELGGDSYLRCPNYKGELISVLQTLHRVKLDQELKVIMVNESKVKCCRNIFAEIEQKQLYKNITGTSYTNRNNVRL